MSFADNPELQAPPTIFREVLVALQNSSGVDLILTTFSLSNGYWDPNAPTGLPTQGYTTGPGQTPTWGNYTPTPYTSVAGTMLFNTAVGGTITVSWTWSYGSTPSVFASTSGTRLKTSSAITNVGSSQVTASIGVTGS